MEKAVLDAKEITGSTSGAYQDLLIVDGGQDH